MLTKFTKPLILTCGAYLALQRLCMLCLCRGSKLYLLPFASLDKEEKATEQALNAEKDDIAAWCKSVPAQNWHLTLTEGTRLYARAFLKPESHKWAVVIHGYGSDGSLMLYAAKRFYNQGFNVLLPDLRAHGKSGGSYIGWGFKDKDDIKKWCRCITDRDSEARTVLYGVSMGAAAALMAAADGAKGVCCAISDCSYTSMHDILCYRIRRMLHLPPLLVMCCFKPLCKKRAGICVDDVSVINYVRQNRIPVMFCHGDRDRFVPTDSVLELYSAAHCPKHLMLVHGAGHGVSAFIGGDAYWLRIFEFVHRFTDKEDTHS